MLTFLLYNNFISYNSKLITFRYAKADTIFDKFLINIPLSLNNTLIGYNSNIGNIRISFRQLASLNNL